MMNENLIKIYEQSFKENKDLPALSDYFKNETFSYFRMAQEIAKLHLLFKEIGIKKGDKIALIGRNNPRWCISYIATITYGAVIVPILQDFNANDIHHIINHSESQLLFVGDLNWDVIETDNIEKIKAAFSLTNFKCIYERKGSKISNYQDNIDNNFIKHYSSGFSIDDIKYKEVDNSKLALLNYTSGTTGFSKGVMLTINNLTGNVVYGMERELYFKKSKCLSFLPLAHAYGCAFDMLLPLAVGAHTTLLGKIPSPKILMEAMAVVRPNIVCCVPLILEKIYKKMIQPQLNTQVMKLALKVPIIDTKIYSTICKKLLEAFGGEIDQLVVGGAPINREVEDFLIKIKFPFTVGYGMTECAPLISYDHWKDYKATSVGKIIPKYMSVRIASDDPQNLPGEIQVKGENVMLGYYKNDVITSEVLDPDGWLHTGDIGTLDPDGTIYIKGRCKTMILGASGQNIYPEEIEAKLNNLPCVMESLVLEREGKLIALVVPDYDQVDSLGIPHSDLDSIMKENIVELNKLVAPFERVANITLYPNEFEKTPKRSIKRYLYTV